MRIVADRPGAERGMVLFSSLMILSLLVTVGVGARVMMFNDNRISGNLRLSTNAFYLAEAGIEWSKHEISAAASHPPVLATRAQNFSPGGFSVAYPSVTAVTPLTAKVVVRSTGTAGTSSHVLQARLTKTYDLADGAVALRGNPRSVRFTGNSFLVSGADHDPATATPIAGTKNRSAITVSSDALWDAVSAGVDPGQQAHIIGAGPGAPSVAKNNYLPSSTVTEMANDLCGSALSIPLQVPTDGVLSVENQQWGTQALPQLRCIEGIAGAGDAVRLGGTVTGVGILVVRNAELIAAGTLHWEGLIIVTGGDVGFTVMGSDSKEILGSLTVNESAAPGGATAMLDIQGNLRLLFSRVALGRITALIPTATLNNAYSVLPSDVTQDYWRAVTP